MVPQVMPDRASRPQIKILNLVLPNWEMLETQIEKEILNYELIPKEEFIKVFHKPHIRMYMDMENEKPLGNNKWSFNVGVNANEDFGWYCDFEGLDCIETGAGD